jgi:acetate kinase
MHSKRSEAPGRILAINGGSSSVKFALFSARTLAHEMSGRIEGIGQERASFTGDRGPGSPPERAELPVPDHAKAIERLADWLTSRRALDGVEAVGHRIVHGGTDLLEHARVTPDLLRKLDEARPLDPIHLPFEIALIEAATRLLPDVPQVACFDTAFHRDLPRVAQLLPIPRAELDRGIRRLGFHGLSYTYLRDELRRVAGDRAADGRVVLAHLGSGASLAAMRGGRPVDTTMAFTPSAGIVMGTRPGDLDPGLLLYLMRARGKSAEEMDRFVNEDCGLLGVSGTTANLKRLEAQREHDPRAAEAIELFVYEAAKRIGAFAAALGGLETLVFSGGAGEHSALVRRGICSRLEFLRVALDERSNEAHAAVISSPGSVVTVRVIPTDEEIVVARIARELGKKGA